MAGLATVIAVGQAQANTQKPIASQTTTNSNGRFANKVVLITGATSGIGMVSAKEFAQEGAKVFFCGRRENLGKKVEGEIKSAGGEATYMQADIR